MRKYQAAMLVLVLMWLMLLQLPSTTVDTQGWFDGSWSFISSAAAQDAPAPAATTDPTLTAAESPPEETGSSLMKVGLILLVVVVPYFVGSFIANALQLKTYGWKLGIILTCLAASSTVVGTSWPPKYGIDLQGGVILIYEIDEELTRKQLQFQDKAEDQDATTTGSSNVSVNMGELVAQLKLRVNPSGLSDISIIPYGKNQVEITIPNNEATDLDVLKDKITTAGYLEFLIVANKSDHGGLLFDPAKDAAEKPDYLYYDDGFVRDSNNNFIGKWVGIAQDEEGNPRFSVGRILGNIADKQPADTSFGYLVRGSIGGDQLEVLMKTEPVPLTGGHLSSAAASRSDMGGLAVSFNMNTIGAGLMGDLTSENAPEGSMRRQLGIVMDGQLISAPNINGRITDRGQITGDFSQAEIDTLVSVLKAGKLPAVLRKEPNSEQKISATLGEDTIAKGKFAVTISIAAVLVFMVFFYHQAGLVACFALLFNLVLTLGIMILFNANLTLPGIAGLVLTVGMSVDANVLIFERIREELKHGSSLRMSLANGFEKATTTIVDANITTLITAVVLYRIGTDQVRGFSVTLIIGILMSMFTAIFCARVIFDIAERKRWIKTLSMLPTVSGSHIDFISKRKVAAIFSLIVIAIGLVSVWDRGKSLFDIDFNGGSSVQVVLTESMEIADVRAKLTGELPDLAVSGVKIDGLEDRVYKIDTSMVGFSQLGKIQLTDHSGKTDTVDLSEKASTDAGESLDSLDRIVKLINLASTGIEAQKNTDSDGFLLIDSSEGENGIMAISNADGDDTETANRLKLSFSTDSPRYETGRIPNGVEVVQAELERIFQDDSGKSMLVMHSMTRKTQPESIKVDAVPRADDATESVGPDTTTTEPEPTTTEPEATTTEPKAETTEPETTTPEPAEDAKSEEEPAKVEEKEEATETPDESDQSRSDLPDDSFVAFNGNPLFLLAQAADPKEAEDKKEEEPVEEVKETEETKEEPAAPATDSVDDQPANEETPLTETDPVTSTPSSPFDLPDSTLFPSDIPTGPAPMLTKITLGFDEQISASAISNKIIDASEAAGVTPRPRVNLYKEGKPIGPQSSVNSDEWDVRFSSDLAVTETILEAMDLKLASTPVWPSSSKIGSKIAGDMQTMAYGALILSLIGIIGYIWFRFQNVAFGLAAVVALVHDVLVTLGAIAISGYLQHGPGFLLIDEFKISLPVVAAFLTIIGYSLNDTIVVFDRIREVRGKSHDLTQEMINTSLNNTLGRTLLTSITTFLVVIILYFLGGQGIHSFAFSLVIGVVVGTYSSIFIASPTLLWLMDREKAAEAKAKAAG